MCLICLVRRILSVHSNERPENWASAVVGGGGYGVCVHKGGVVGGFPAQIKERGGKCMCVWVWVVLYKRMCYHAVLQGVCTWATHSNPQTTCTHAGTFSVGDVVNGRYTILQELGSGSSSTTYKVLWVSYVACTSTTHCTSVPHCTSITHYTSTTHYTSVT